MSSFTIDEKVRKQQADWLKWVREEKKIDVNKFSAGFMRDIAKKIVNNEDLSFFQILKFSKSSGLWKEKYGSNKKPVKKIIKKKPVIKNKTVNEVTENDIIKKLKSMKKDQLIDLIMKSNK